MNRVFNSFLLGCLTIVSIAAFVHTSSAQDHRPSGLQPKIEEDHAEEAAKWLEGFRNPMHEPDYYEKRASAFDEFSRMDNRPAMKATSSAAWIQAGYSQQDCATGRASCIAFDPSGTIYLGAISGGLWRSNDNGKNWTSLSDTWKDLVVGGLAVDQQNPSVIYCGTGSPNSYVGGGGDLNGVGIYKSVDGGLNWYLITGIMANTAICQIEVNKADPNLVYCATTSGIDMSSDSGHTWKTVNSSVVYKTSLALDPNNAGVLYASGYGDIEKSVDSGKTWSQLSGYPVDNVLVVAMSNVSSDSIYASTGSGAQRGYSGSVVGFSTIYLSTDAGGTWNLVSQDENYLGEQAYYANAIAVNPTNPAIVVVGGLDIYSSTKAGASLTKRTDWTAIENNSDYSHADIHRLTYNPYNNELYSMTDGGIFHSANNGFTWQQDMNARLPTMLFIGGDMGVDANGNPAIFGAGAQDNATSVLLPAKSTTTYNVITSGDGGTVYISPTDGQTIFATYTNATLFSCNDGGAQWSTDLAKQGFGTFSPQNLLGGTPINNTSTPFYIEYDVCDQDPTVIAVCGGSTIYGTNTGDLFLSNDGGQNALAGQLDFPQVTNTGDPNTEVIGGVNTVHIAKNNSQYVFIGTSSSKMYYSTDQGTTWTPSKTILSGAPTSITSDPVNETHLFMTVAGTGGKHFYVSTDTGRTWSAPAKGLPNFNYHRIAVDSNGNIFIGHDFGVLRSQNGGVNWYPVADGFPAAMVTSLHVRGHYLMATTYGRGMFYVDIDQLPSLLNSVAPTTASNIGGPQINDIYPNIAMTSAPRVNLDYSLADDTRAKLTIFDVLGREERVLFNDYTSKGEHSIVGNLSGLAPGQHYIVLTADGFSTTKPVTIE